MVLNIMTLASERFVRDAVARNAEGRRLTRNPFIDGIKLLFRNAVIDCWRHRPLMSANVNSWWLSIANEVVKLKEARKYY